MANMNRVSSGRVIKRRGRRSNQTSKVNGRAFCQQRGLDNEKREQLIDIENAIKKSVKYVCNVMKDDNDRNGTKLKMRNKLNSECSDKSEESIYNDAVIAYRTVSLKDEQATQRTNNTLRGSTNTVGVLNHQPSTITPYGQHSPDPLDTFFSLISYSVKNFSQQDQHNVKSNVFRLVSSIEWKNMFPAPQSKPYNSDLEGKSLKPWKMKIKRSSPKRASRCDSVTTGLGR